MRETEIAKNKVKRENMLKRKQNELISISNVNMNTNSRRVGTYRTIWLRIHERMAL